VCGFVAISITLLACTAHKHQSGKFVFGGFINTTGWNDGAAWLLGFLQGAFTLVAYDATVHLIEEMPNPRRDAPWTMVLAVATGSITGFIFLMCALFAVQDVDMLISAATGPIVEIFNQATQSKGAAAGMTAIIIVILTCSSTEVVTSSSRLTAAFARQGGLPFPELYVPSVALSRSCQTVSTLTKPSTASPAQTRSWTSR
jgi:choline transport protein